MSAETRMNGINLEKKCTACNEFKSLVDFAYKANGLYNTRSWCKQCEYAKNKEYLKTYQYDKEKKKEYHKQYYEEHKEEMIRNSRLNVLKRKFNLSEEEFNELAKDGCQICGSFDKLCVDHEHTSNLIRGIICHKCNTAIGLLDDNIEKILKAAAYLEERKYALQRGS